jgi:ketosteroid isomerase-like protein
MNKRDMALGLLAGLGGAGLLGMASTTTQAAVSEADARAAIAAWLDPLQEGDPAKIEAVLAPEFQLLRSDGTGHDKTTYLSDLPKQTSKPEITDLVFSGEGDVIVTRYMLQLDQTINNKPVQTKAPRLSVFRRGGASWLIVAHANFAQIG